MKFRISTVNYKSRNKVHTDSIYIRRLNSSDIETVDNKQYVSLKLYRDETGAAVVTENSNGVKEYQVNMPIKQGAYAYIPVTTMKALLANSQVKRLGSQEWVTLELLPEKPTYATLTTAETVTKL